MKTRRWTIAAVLVLTGLLVAGIFWKESSTSARLSAEAEAVGLVATPMEWYDSVEEENVTGHTLTYGYAAGPAVFARTLDQITWYEPGTEYKICYDPGDPADSRLFPAEHDCGSCTLALRTPWSPRPTPVPRGVPPICRSATLASHLLCSLGC